ncbi:MAG: hypothetical protein F6J90_20590 [Moorea sp. SIOASIH]|uniref:hypothetical protein n=1 Tax=Moorena sp. SIOASIH TaxID=2607817 RepID=UPI0013BC79CD|nr:hypothetical protein [Moorena sp. SIOASIH]NEO38599.1 hypothetical protein [Moorena sp. SIOASIH]
MNINLKLLDCTRSKHNLTLLYQYDEITFTTTLWYSTVDFHQLESEYSQEYMEKIYFHILLFHGLKILSLKPTHLDLGKYGNYWTNNLEKLWEVSVEQCLGQWRYETDNLDYQGAEIIHQDVTTIKIEAVTLVPGSTPLLLCNGGGKDSLLMARLLDDNSVPFDSFSINLHTHANPEELFELHEQHLYKLQNPPPKIHRQYIIESFLNSPAAKLHGVEGVEVSEIRNYEDLPLAYGMFGILPVILQEKYTQLCFGNEKSADSEQVKVGNQVINHAWCKSTECEILYEEYIQQEFISNLAIFSLLKPYSDILVYQVLAQNTRGDDLKLVYSCNTSPPWCKSCPKCAYVYLSYMAYLTPEHANEVQHLLGKENLFDRPDLQLYYRQLMGLEAHNAFECVGEIEETKLALEKCVERGFTGEAINCYSKKARLDRSEYQKLWEKYHQLDFSYQRLPPKLMEILIEECQKLENK